MSDPHFRYGPSMVVTIGAAFLASLFLAPTAFATMDTLIITENTTLTEDHIGEIHIRADGITLNCAGHTVFGPGNPGIWLVNVDEVTVENCNLDGLETGIHLVSSSNNLLIGNTIVGGIGFVFNVLLQDSHDNRLENNTSLGGVNGIRLAGSNNNFLTGNTVEDSKNQGISLINGSNHNVVQDNIVDGASEISVFLQDSHDNRLRDNMTIEGGISLSGSTHNVLTGNTAVGGGIGLNGGSNHNVVKRNTGNSHEINSSHYNILKSNVATGGEEAFSLSSATNNLLKENISEDALFIGFRLVGDSTDNKLVGNQAIGANQLGFWLFFVSNNKLKGNVAHDNAGAGFAVTGGSDHILSKNLATENGASGFALVGGTDSNTLSKNKAFDNAEYGISDETSGAIGDHGTDNFYAKNVCEGNGLGGSQPLGLCLP